MPLPAFDPVRDAVLNSPISPSHPLPFHSSSRPTSADSLSGSAPFGGLVLPGSNSSGMSSSAPTQRPASRSPSISRRATDLSVLLNNDAPPPLSPVTESTPQTPLFTPTIERRGSTLSQILLPAGTPGGAGGIVSSPSPTQESAEVNGQDMLGQAAPLGRRSSSSSATPATPAAVMPTSNSRERSASGYFSFTPPPSYSTATPTHNPSSNPTGSPLFAHSITRSPTFSRPSSSSSRYDPVHSEALSSHKLMAPPPPPSSVSPRISPRVNHANVTPASSGSIPASNSFIPSMLALPGPSSRVILPSSPRLANIVHQPSIPPPQPSPSRARSASQDGFYSANPALQQQRRVTSRTPQPQPQFQPQQPQATSETSIVSYSQVLPSPSRHARTLSRPPSVQPSPAHPREDASSSSRTATPQPEKTPRSHRRQPSDSPRLHSRNAQPPPPLELKTERHPSPVPSRPPSSHKVARPAAAAARLPQESARATPKPEPKPKPKSEPMDVDPPPPPRPPSPLKRPYAPTNRISPPNSILTPLTLGELEIYRNMNGSKRLWKKRNEREVVDVYEEIVKRANAAAPAAGGVVETKGVGGGTVRKREPGEPEESARKVKRRKDDKQLIEEHYNARPDVGRVARQQSPIIGLKAFNNWIKSVLIQKFAHPALIDSPFNPGRSAKQERGYGRQIVGGKVLDMGCGKGGDLTKWAKAKVGEYVGVDIAALSVDQARARHDQMHITKKFPAYFAALDCFAQPLSDALPTTILQASAPGSEDVGGPFDVISLQFCMHYAFETEKKARCMLDNVSRYLRKGGMFIGTVPNGEWLLDRLESLPPSAPPAFGNSVYSVQFDTRAPREQRPIFGDRYFFFLKDAVENVPEYVVQWDYFVSLAAEYSLYPVYKREFHDVFQDEQGHPEFGPLLIRMKVQDPDGSSQMDEDQWEAANVYNAFAMVKR